MLFVVSRKSDRSSHGELQTRHPWSRKSVRRRLAGVEAGDEACVKNRVKDEQPD